MNNLTQIITSIPPPFNMIVLIVLITTGAGVVKTIAKQVRLYTSHRHELDLKRELVDRGMPTDEIERVVRARSAATDSKA